jgi:DNA-binding LacI/PurR family transcriptional regulator
LTTVRQPTVEMGMASARALLEELRGHGFSLPTFNTDLVVRDSTAPAPGRS